MIIMSADLGKARTGIAVSDPGESFAFPKTVITEYNEERLIKRICECASLYGAELISERHRHRYEVNNDYRCALCSAGMRFCGQSPDGRIIEMVELPELPFFIATQAHPEFNSRPTRPHPLFLGLISAALAEK